MTPAASPAGPAVDSGPRRIGRYEVVRRLARGGMAEVLLVRSTGPGGVTKLLCAKRILPAAAPDPRAAARFLDEARTTLGLAHAGIVPVFDFGRDDQDFFLIMEWIDGCDLGALLDGLGPRRLPHHVVGHVLGQVAGALAYAHERRDSSGKPAGILHRDVTPRNVLLSRQGEVRLTDFGIARSLGAAGAPSGTPAYMAPEAARGEAADARSDLYSLGLVGAEMLQGHRLRARADLEAAREAVDIGSLRVALAATDAGPLVDIVVRLLAPEARDRFDSAAAVEAALAPVLASATLAGAEPAPRVLARLVGELAPESPSASDGGQRAATQPATEAAATRTDRALLAVPPPPAVLATTLPSPVGTTAKTGSPGSGTRPGRLVLGAAVGAVAVVTAIAIGVGLFGSDRPAAPADLATRPPTARSRAPRPTEPPTAPGPTAAPTAAAPGAAAAAGSAAPAPPPAPATVPSPATATTPAARDLPSGPTPGARAAARTAPARARLRITAPGSWVSVYLDGRKLGDDAGEFEIPAGRHVVRAHNPPLGFDESRTIEAAPGATVSLEFRPGR